MSRKQTYIEELGAIDEKLAELKARKEKLHLKMQKFPGKTLGITFMSNVYIKNHVSIDSEKVKRLLGTKYKSCLTNKEITIVSIRRIPNE